MSRRSLATKIRRRQQREQEYLSRKAAHKELRAQGKVCGTCKHVGRAPVTRRAICQLDSDGSGYVTVALGSQTCRRWAPGVPERCGFGS